MLYKVIQREGIKALFMNNRCHQITDEGVNMLGAGIMKNLQELETLRLYYLQ